MTRPDTTTYRYTSPRFAQDMRSLARLQRHDARVRWIRGLMTEILIKAVAPAVAFGLIVGLTHTR